jgi:hypothetical protein
LDTTPQIHGAPFWKGNYYGTSYWMVMGDLKNGFYWVERLICVYGARLRWIGLAPNIPAGAVLGNAFASRPA